MLARDLAQEQLGGTRMMRLEEVVQLTTLGTHRVAWRSDEVQAWMVSRVEATSEHLRK